MQRFLTIAFAATVIATSLAPASSPAAPSNEKGKTCRVEQQCRWENFKKICVYVKVCR